MPVPTGSPLAAIDALGIVRVALLRRQGRRRPPRQDEVHLQADQLSRQVGEHARSGRRLIGIRSRNCFPTPRCARVPAALVGKASKSAAFRPAGILSSTPMRYGLAAWCCASAAGRPNKDFEGEKQEENGDARGGAHERGTPPNSAPTPEAPQRLVAPPVRRTIIRSRSMRNRVARARAAACRSLSRIRISALLACLPVLSVTCKLTRAPGGRCSAAPRRGVSCRPIPEGIAGARRPHALKSRSAGLRTPAGPRLSTCV